MWAVWQQIAHIFCNIENYIVPLPKISDIMALYENQVCEYLNIPSIPKKKWDGKKSFLNGVALLSILGDREAYAVCTFDSDTDSEPRIKKVFSLEKFNEVKEIYPVPAYMDTDVDNMDLDEESKENAKFLVIEADEVVADHEEAHKGEDNEYFFDNIRNDEEAKAFIKAYNKEHKIKGGLPRTHDGLIMRLSVIHSELSK